MAITNEPTHPSEYVMIYCTARKKYVKVASNQCVGCNTFVDISNPATYYLDRYLGNSEYGYQVQHLDTSLCADAVQTK